MDNLKELLLKSAGIIRDSIKVEDTVPTINAPRGGKDGTHSNPRATRKGTSGQKQDINVQRAGTEGKEGDFQIIRTGTRKTYPSPEYQNHEGYKSPDATTKTADRGGSDGKEIEISITRGGVKGTQSDVDIQRGGTKGGNSDITIKRGGIRGAQSDIVTERSGKDGSTSEVNIHRAGVEGSHSDPQYESHKHQYDGENFNPEVVRTGTQKVPVDSKEYKTSHSDYNSPSSTIDTPERSGSGGSKTDIRVDRSGTPGTQSDVDIQRGGTKGGNSDITIKRGGIRGAQSDIVTERSGKDGSTSEVNIHRAGVEGSHSDPQYESHKHQYDGENFNPEVVRTGTQKVPVDSKEYKTSHSDYNSPSSTIDTPERSGSGGSKTDIRVDRSGTPGTQSDVDIQRGGNLGSKEDIQYQKHNAETPSAVIEIPGRSGTEGSTQEMKVTRSGTSGSTSEQDYKEHHNTYDGSDFDAGVIRPGTKRIPVDSEDYPFKHNSYESPDSLTETPKRGGFLGRISNPVAKRTDSETSETDYEYVGFEEYESPESDIDTAKRSPSESQESDVQYQEHSDYESPESTTQTAPRGGTDGSDKPLTLTDIIKAEIAMTEIGKAQLDESAALIKEQTQLPNDVNEWSMNNTQRWYDKLSNTLGRINKIAENVIGFGGFLGLKLPNITNLNTWLKMIPGSPGVELITGFNANNQDLLAYCKFMCNHPMNWVRIASDLLFRYTTLTASQDITRVSKALWVGDSETNDNYGSSILKEGGVVAKAAMALLKLIARRLKMSEYNWLSGQQGQKSLQFEKDWWDSMKTRRQTLDQSHPINPYNGSEDITREKMLFYDTETNLDPSNPKLLSVDQMFADGKFRPEFKDTAIRKLAGAIVNGQVSESDDWFAGYARWQDFEFSDDMWWGCSIYPYQPDGQDNFSRLPKFPPQYQDGWWPVVNASFNKGSIRSKSFNLPFFDLDLPVSATRPSQLRITFVDDVKRSIRYWLEEYIRLVFDFDTNSTVPYKHLCLLIELYRYDITRAVLYRKKFICMIKDPTSVFNGGNAHQLDEIDIEFNIVGEQTDRDLYRKYELYNPLQS